MRRRRLCGAAFAALVPALQVGCALPPPPPPTPIPPNAKLFARAPAPAAPRTRGRVALLAKPDVRSATKVTLSYLQALQVGAMVEQALVLALDEGLQGGVQQVAAMPPAGSAFDAVLELRWVQLEFRQHAFPPRTVGLDFDLALLDGRGRTAWSKIYHDAKDYPLGEQLTLVDPGETAMETEVRLAHEAAWRLAQQVLRDLREWLEAERLRPREL
jgi:hypothetical protein